MTIKLSNSELQTFKECRRRWWLSYYRALKPKGQDFTGALVLGTRIHASLEAYYSLGTPLLQAHATLVEIDRNLILAAFEDPSELNTEAELGRIMLEGYEQWIQEEAIDQEFDIVSLEERVSVPLFNGEVELQGKLDMRVRRKSDGVRLFNDFKTTGVSIAEFASMAAMNEQVKTYMLLETLKTGEETRTDGALFTLLRKVKRTAAAKPPFYAQIEVHHNVFTMRAFWNSIHSVIADLMKARTALDAGEAHSSVVYPHPTRDCRWKCQFFTVCTMFDDGSAVEEALNDMYEVTDPYAYYGTDKKGSE